MRKLSIKKLLVVQALITRFNMKRKGACVHWVPAKTLGPATLEKLTGVAEALIENYIPVKDYIEAQFRFWNGPSGTLPQLNQIATEGAMERWNKHAAAIGFGTLTAEIRAHQTEHTLRHDEKMLARCMQRTGLSEKELLARDFTEYSRAFLVKKGLWRAVAERWTEINGDF